VKRHGNYGVYVFIINVAAYSLVHHLPQKIFQKLFPSIFEVMHQDFNYLIIHHDGVPLIKIPFCAAAIGASGISHINW
jgi:hypothetical protein